MTGFTRTAALTGNWPRPAPRAPRCVWPRAAPLIPPHIRAQNQGGNSILGPNLPHNWTWILQKMIHFSRARVGNISLLTSGWRLPLLAMTRLVPPVSCVQHGHGESKSVAVCILHPIRTVVRPSWSLTWLPCLIDIIVRASYKLTPMKLQNIWVIRHVQACKGEMFTMYRQKYDGMKWLRNKTQWAILACNLADAKICNLRWLDLKSGSAQRKFCIFRILT